MLNHKKSDDPRKLFRIAEEGVFRSLRPLAGGRQGRSDGVGYIYIYTPQKISNYFVHVWDINTCFEIAMTS